MYDTIIIGAGIVGCCTARALSLFTGSVCVLERQGDLSEGTTKANSAIVHAGYDAKPGSLKARYNVRGSRMYADICRDLDVSYRNNGSLVLCNGEADRPTLVELYERGKENGVEGLRIVERDELFAMEPSLQPGIVAALYAPTGAITCPYGLAQAMAENAVANGAKFFFDSAVTAMERRDDHFVVSCGDAVFYARAVVNAAGVYADEIAAMAGSAVSPIAPRKGEYCIFDKAAGGMVSHTLFQLPTKLGKGVLVTPTVDGNLMVGPSAEDIEDKGDLATTQAGMDMILEKGLESVVSIPTRQIITSFAGLRATSAQGDFTVGEDARVQGLYHASGIESPGLTAAPAIAEDLCTWIAQALGLKERADAVTKRAGIRRLSEMTQHEREEAIEKDPAYGQIVCRCETVSEAEVVQAIHRAPGARTIDGVKRRTRCGMGRCQGGFCMPRVSAILQRELGLAPEQVTKKGPRATLTVGAIEEVRSCESNR